MNVWAIGFLVLLLLLITVMLGLLVWLSTKNRAADLRETNQGIPIGPVPPQSHPIKPTGFCLPQKSTDGFKECTSSLECKQCTEKPNGKYLECASVPYNQTVTVNGAQLTSDGKNYCLPPKFNVCTPGYSESVWKAEGGLENWECDCTYDAKYNVFRQTTHDSDCNVNVACNRYDYMVCNNDALKPCTQDTDCADAGKCVATANRLVSRPRAFVADQCSMNQDPECEQTYVSNFARSDAKPTAGTGMPGKPLLVKKEADSEGNLLGITRVSWDPNLDGPLLYDDFYPAWMAEGKINPNCTEQTNPGCSVALTDWGGECRCDPNQNLISWKDYQEATAVVPPSNATAARIQVQEESSQFFSCRPDTCHVPVYKKVGEGDPGPRLVTPDNTKYLFSNALGEVPENLAPYQCWCGNVKQNEADNTFKSWLPYKQENQPNAPPTCREDPCNPNGYFDPTATDKDHPERKGLCICKNNSTEQISAQWPFSKCVNICDRNICGTHGRCVYDDKAKTYKCICDNCYGGERCQIHQRHRSFPCDSDDQCCGNLTCKFGECY